MPVYKKVSEKTGKVSWYAIFYYKDWTGKRIQKKKEGFATKREAKAYEQDFLDRVAGSPSMAFSSLVELYMADHRKHFRQSSSENVQLLLDKRIIPFFKDIPINQVTPATVREWQGSIKSSKGYAPTTLRATHAVLSAVFNFAVKYYGLPQNPARLAGAMGKAKPPPVSFYTLQEFKQLQKAMEGHEPYYTIFTLLFYTGIRKGELLALTLEDFDFAGSTLTISKTLNRIKGKTVIQPPKTEKGKRVITIPPSLVSIVRTYVESLYKLEAGQRLFECTSSALRSNLNKFAALAGLRHIRVHDLRHSHASLLIEQGFSPLVIRDRLGHEDIETTLNTYSHLYPGKQEEVSARLEELSK